MDFSVLFGLVTSGAGLLTGKFRKGGAREAWQAAAEHHGLLHKPAGFWSGPKLSGPLSGNELTVDLKNRGTASEATRFRLGMPSLNLGLRLRKRGFWNSFRLRTVTGDKAFDSQVVAEGRNQFAVREFLTPERRAALLSFVSAFKGAVVTDDEISFTTSGQVKKSEEMLGAIAAMMQVASAIAEATPSTARSHGERASAAAIVPTDTVGPVASESELAPEPTPEPTPELEPEPEPEPEPDLAHADEPERAGVQADEPDSTPGVEEFCATVFAPGVLSIAANQKFKESYAGERIAWTGTLESMTPFTFDFDFGSGRGIKAVLTILDSEAVGSRKVQAVIGLPPGIEGLDARIGQPVAFTGRLLKVDGLAKRVVIADARLRN